MWNSILFTGFYFDHSSDGQDYWNYLNVTVILTDRRLDGPYEAAARKLRNHGVIVHAVGWLDVRYTVKFFKNGFAKLFIVIGIEKRH